MPPRASSARKAEAAPPPQRARKSRTAATPEDAATDAVLLAETLLEEAPHVGREAEYEAVVSFVARRATHESNTALFVCGGCGCGKTSTIKRALRAMSGRVLPCDAKSRSLVKRGSLEERGWGSAEAHLEDMHTPRSSHQRSSGSGGLTVSPSLSSALSRTSSAATAAAAATDSAVSTPAVTRRGSEVLVDSPPEPLRFSPMSGRPSASSEDSTASVLAAAGPAHGSFKRSREEEEEEKAAAAAHEGGGRRARGHRVDAAPYSLEYFQTRYPEVFAAAGNGPQSASRRAYRTSGTPAATVGGLYGHYVNCADLSGAALVEAICESIQATCTRTDSATHTLLQQLAHLNAKSGGRDGAVGKHAAAKDPSHTTKAPLHVVALDEVEYVRGGGAKTLAQLAELAFQLPAQLAFIFISNQRAFVHVPQMMLEALLFEPYSEEQLRSIGADATAAELRRCETLANGAEKCRPSIAAGAGRKRASTKASEPRVCAADVDIKPRLYDYIARKALLEYSGDVRQVIAMCHRVVSVAWEEVVAAAAATAAATTSKAAMKTRSATGTASNLPAKLEAAVETFHADSSRVGDRSAAGSASSSTRSSAALVSSNSAGASSSSAASSTSASASASSSGVMTLAKSVRLLQSNQVESDIDRYVGTLPEQTLYVLSCIVVLTLRKQEERTHAVTSVGGRMGTPRTPGAGVAASQRNAPTLSLKLHEVHQLYTRLMAELHFPAMRADGFPLQVECLADFGVLTRPQLRGTDRVFSLNGTWTLEAMQQALVRRGEAIKQDRLAAGMEAVMENKFEEVLRELSRLIKY